jgi:hypothetical protein
MVVFFMGFLQVVFEVKSRRTRVPGISGRANQTFPMDFNPPKIREIPGEGNGMLVPAQSRPRRLRLGTKRRIAGIFSPPPAESGDDS